jgi:hypothetical protein
MGGGNFHSCVCWLSKNKQGDIPYLENLPVILALAHQGFRPPQVEHVVSVRR